MGVSENYGYPQIIHFNRDFHYKPSILGYPYLRKPPEIYHAWNFTRSFSEESSVRQPSACLPHPRLPDTAPRAVCPCGGATTPGTSMTWTIEIKVKKPMCFFWGGGLVKQSWCRWCWLEIFWRIGFLLQHRALFELVIYRPDSAEVSVADSAERVAFKQGVWKAFWLQSGPLHSVANGVTVITLEDIYAWPYKMDNWG